MGRKTFIAVIVIFALLVFLLAGMQAVEVALANPYMYVDVEDGVIPPPEGTNPLSILISSPTNNTAYSSNHISLNFTVSNNASTKYRWSDLYYTTSWSTDNSSNNLLDANTNFLQSRECSINLTNIPEGPCWIEICAAAKAFAYETSHTIEGIFYTYHYISYEAVTVSTVNFTVEAISPTPTLSPSVRSPLATADTIHSLAVVVISPQNRTYDSNDIPISISASDPTLNIGPESVAYSVDGGPQVIIGNANLGMHNLTNSTVLTLPNGDHTIVGIGITWFNGAEGVFYSPQIHFKVNASTPSLSKSILPSSTVELSPKPTGIQENYTSTIITGGLVVATVVVVGLLLYFARRKK